MKKSDAERLFLATWDKHSHLDLVPEFRFHETRRWRFDFAIPDLMLAIEIDGFGFGHTSMKGLSRDNEKNNAAQKQGWTVLRYTAKSVKEDPRYVVDDILEYVDLMGYILGEEE